MNQNEISTLIRFNFWANGRLLAACEHLTLDEFTREVTPDPGWGTLRGILVHILDTEFGWRSVLQPEVPDIILQATDFANVATLKERWKTEEAAWLAYVNTLTSNILNQNIYRDGRDGPTVWQTCMHVILHGNQHRGEAALILTGYGRSPGELDFAVFMKENPGYLESKNQAG